MSGCCAPSRDPTPGGSDAAAAVPERTAAAAVAATVRIPAGEALLGNTDMHAYPGDGEGPVHPVRLDAFELAPHAVTNNEFGRFAEATGYRTEAERFGWSFVFGGLLPDDFPPTRGVAAAPWWRQVDGAWLAPPGGAAVQPRRTRRPSRSSTSPGTTRSRTARGRGRGSRPRPSGSTPPAAASRAASSRGATSSSPAASTA